MKYMGTITTFSIALFSSICTLPAHATAQYAGVNLSGAEYADCSKVGARYGYDYIYATTADIDAFIALGMNTFRVPFCWERIQPSLRGALDSAELARLDTLVKYITAKNSYVILDLHNYAVYKKTPLATSGTITKRELADIWQRLAQHYRDNDKVIFGLMNEPQGIAAELWVEAANKSIADIRNTTAKNLILVPGVAWTGAHSWTSTSYGTSNSTALLNIVDPANNFAYEVHQYLDGDSSGTSSTCVDANIGVKRIGAFTDWARKHRAKAFLGEFAGGRNDVCYSAVFNLLSAMETANDVWIGWTYWSTGAWQPDYMFNVPTKIISGQKTQLDILKQFLPCTSSDCIPSPPTIKTITPE